MGESVSVEQSRGEGNSVEQTRSDESIGFSAPQLDLAVRAAMVS
jgi:hypothetical protein